MSAVSRSLPSKVPALRVGSSHREEWSCPRLKILAEQLRRYRAPPSPVDEDSIMSSVGMPASEASRNDLNVFPTIKRAAVLVCLYQGADEEFRVILTKRAGSLSSHSGEVALPGGKRDEGDADDTATALREAHEEIGLLPSHVRVVTSLEPFLSKVPVMIRLYHVGMSPTLPEKVDPNFHVTSKHAVTVVKNLLTVIPVVGLLDDMKKFVPVPNPGEVDAIFDAPLEMFLKNENYWFQEREWLGVKYRVHFFDYATDGGERFLVWGLTASMLIRTASIIYKREPAFLEFAPDFEKMVKSAQGVRWSPLSKPSTTDVKTFEKKE